jgi:hypothetical protein
VNWLTHSPIRDNYRGFDIAVQVEQASCLLFRDRQARRLSHHRPKGGADLTQPGNWKDSLDELRPWLLDRTGQLISKLMGLLPDILTHGVGLRGERYH